MIKPAEPVYLPCCGVFAAFLAAPGERFDDFFDFAQEKLKRRSNWQGSMLWREVLALLSMTGVRHSPIEGEKSIGKTVHRAIKDGDFLDGRQYVIRISGHFLTVRGELCYDQTNPHGKHVSLYRKRRSKITHCTKIL